MEKIIYIGFILLLMLVGCGKEEATKEVEHLEAVEESAAEKEEREIFEAAKDREATEVKQPLEVKPGNYTFGEDIRTGRYKITSNSSEKGTVYVKNQEGFIEVAERFEEDTEYVFDADIYDSLETDIAIILNPVE